MSREETKFWEAMRCATLFPVYFCIASYCFFGLIGLGIASLCMAFIYIWLRNGI